MEKYYVQSLRKIRLSPPWEMLCRSIDLMIAMVAHLKRHRLEALP